jgi:hypothetical protein
MAVMDDEEKNVFVKNNSYSFADRLLRFFIYNYSGNPAEITIEQIRWDPVVFEV